MTYSATKFEVATSNRLVGDTFTRKVTDAQTDGRRIDFGTKLIYPFFLKKKVGITNDMLGPAYQIDPMLKRSPMGNPIIFIINC